MKKPTKQELAEIALRTAEGWYDEPFDYQTFLRILDGAIAAAEAGLTTDVPWCQQPDDHLKGLCVGCRFNMRPARGGSTNCVCYEKPSD